MPGAVTMGTKRDMTQSLPSKNLPSRGGDRRVKTRSCCGECIDTTLLTVNEREDLKCTCRGE